MMVTHLQCSIHQEECRYQPSRRGGARRGPLAAQKLARKRAQRAADIANINNHDEFDSNVSGQGFNFHSHLNAPFPFPSMSRSTISLEFPSPPSGFVDQQESSGGTVELPGGSIRVYRCDQDLYVNPMRRATKEANLESDDSEESTPTISSFILTFPVCLPQQCLSTKTRTRSSASVQSTQILQFYPIGPLHHWVLPLPRYWC